MTLSTRRILHLSRPQGYNGLMETKAPSSKIYQIVSWGITALIVVSLVSIAFWRLQNRSVPLMPAPAPTQVVEMPATDAEPTLVPAADLPGATAYSDFSIARNLKLKTIIPERPNYAVKTYTVQRGDSIMRIASMYKVKPETVLWANFDILDDDPHGLKPGQELRIPPTDGLYYEWQEGDSLDKVINKYETKLDDVVYWPGNKLEVANPKIKPGDWVMLPNGWRESKQQTIVSDVSVSKANCSGNTGGFGLPTGSASVSGNDYYPGHPGIDFAGNEGDSVYASDGGVVIKASGGWNGGYGNVIMIDHCNGYVTVYAHLSSFNVSAGTRVGRGSVIGYVGNTGNSFGAHLHFEVRLNGAHINPWGVFQ